MLRANSFFILGASLFFLQACSGMGVVQTEIMRVHVLPPDLVGKKVLASPLESQKGRVEFDLYAKDLTDHLVARGLVPTSNYLEADYVAFMLYQVSDGKVVTKQVPVYEQIGGGTQSVRVARPGELPETFNVTTEPEFGFTTVTSTEIVYSRGLFVRLADRQKTEAAQAQNPRTNPVWAFEGSALSTGEASSFLSVSKCMVNALMDDFPGVSGTTKKVTGFSGNCSR